MLQFYEIFNKKPVRAITLGGAQLVPDTDSFMQFSFFDNGTRQKRESVEDAIDLIRKKYGTQAVSVGTLTKT